MILAVTVLTSLNQDDLVAVGVNATPVEQVLRLGCLAVNAGADGLVCSPLEVAPLRQALGVAVKLVVPGIRPAGSTTDDQGRTMTPAQAIAAGADWIVVGRPITNASDPGLAAAEIAASIR
jgi:orotidine-5'-phosphate decarboxylase